MRDIIKNIKMSIDGTEMDFRLTKLDAFSGVSLLRMLMCHSERRPKAGAEESPSPDSPVLSLFVDLTEADLRSLMTSCLNHVEVLLPAGYQPVMQGSSWSWEELEHDAASCLKLVIEEIAWTLSGFFLDGGSPSKAAAPNT